MQKKKVEKGGVTAFWFLNWWATAETPINNLEKMCYTLHLGTVSLQVNKMVLELWALKCFLLFLMLFLNYRMSLGLTWKWAAKSNRKLANQKYATLFLSWMALYYLNFLCILCDQMKSTFSVAPKIIPIHLPNVENSWGLIK